MVETIGIILGILGLVIAFIALRKDHYSKPKDELNHLKLQFQMTKTLSEKVQKQIADYIQINDAAKNLIFQNVTFEKYLSMMKENYNQSLSTDSLKKLESLKLSKPNILSATKSLEDQFSALQAVENHMKTIVL